MQLLIKQKYWSFKDKFTITDENGNPWFQVQSNFWGFKQFFIYDMNGKEILHLKVKFNFFVPKWEFDVNGQVVAIMKGKFFHVPFRRSYTLTGEGITDLKIKGDCYGWNFKAYKNGTKEVVAEQSKKLMKIADTYTLNIYDDTVDPAYLLGMTLVLDALHQSKH